MGDYDDLIMYLDSQGYDNISGFEMYQYIFPDFEESGEQAENFSKPNPIFLYYDADMKRVRRRIMLQDTWESDYMEYIEGNDLCLCSGLLYRGRANKLENGQKMAALIFDIDDVGLDEFRVMQARWELEAGRPGSIPCPTITVLSGSGVHLYYVFEEAIDLFPNIKIQMKALKYDLTHRIWIYGQTSKRKSLQFQSINQSFRMPGSYNCKDPEQKRLVTAYMTGEKVSVDYLNRFVSDSQNRVDIEKRFAKSRMTREEAKISFSEWYERVVVPQLRMRDIEAQLSNESVSDKEKKELMQELTDLRIQTKARSKKKWAINEKVHGDDPYALYHWFVSHWPEIIGGHRYYFLMCMAIYADKCNLPRATLVKDMDAVYRELAKIPYKNPLTKSDVRSALEAYSKEYFDTQIESINLWTGLKIERKKRNFRTQWDHLQAEVWVNKDGRKVVNDCKAHREFGYRQAVSEGRVGRPKGSGSKQVLIAEYRQNNPCATPKDCSHALEIHINTVYKWWKK